MLQHFACLLAVGLVAASDVDEGEVCDWAGSLMMFSSPLPSGGSFVGPVIGAVSLGQACYLFGQPIVCS